MVRFKNRYLLCSFAWEDGKTDLTVQNKELYRNIRESILRNFGDFGIGVLVSSLSVKY